MTMIKPRTRLCLADQWYVSVCRILKLTLALLVVGLTQIRELQTISPQIDGQAPSEGCKWGQIKSAIGPCVDP